MSDKFCVSIIKTCHFSINLVPMVNTGFEVVRLRSVPLSSVVFSTSMASSILTRYFAFRPVGEQIRKRADGRGLPQPSASQNQQSPDLHPEITVRYSIFNESSVLLAVNTKKVFFFNSKVLL